MSLSELLEFWGWESMEVHLREATPCYGLDINEITSMIKKSGSYDIPYDNAQRLTTSYEKYIVTCVSSSLVMIRLCVIIRHERDDA